MYHPLLKFVALPVPEIIAIEVLVLDGGCEPQSWGREDRKGSGMVPSEKVLVSSYIGHP